MQLVVDGYEQQRSEGKMATDLSILKPIPAPDPHRPTDIPLWPEWLVSLLGLTQKTPSGSLELRTKVTPQQHCLISNYVGAIESLIAQTPESQRDCRRATLLIVTKMLITLGGSKRDETENETKGEAYMMALDDVPSWAVEAAARGWYRGSHGSEHDYRWMPCPATLRNLALGEAHRLKGRAVVLRKLLAAKVVDYSDEHRQSMLQKLAAVLGAISQRAAPQARPIEWQEGATGKIEISAELNALMTTKLQDGSAT